MSSEQAIVVQEPTSNLLPFDPAILTGQLRPSSIAMYRRDMAAYLVYAQAQGFDALSSATFSRRRTALAQDTPLSPHTINRQLRYPGFGSGNAYHPAGGEEDEQR